MNLPDVSDPIQLRAYRYCSAGGAFAAAWIIHQAFSLRYSA